MLSPREANGIWNDCEEWRSSAKEWLRHTRHWVPPLATPGLGGLNILSGAGPHPPWTGGPARRAGCPSQTFPFYTLAMADKAARHPLYGDPGTHLNSAIIQPSGGESHVRVARLQDHLVDRRNRLRGLLCSKLGGDQPAPVGATASEGYAGGGAHQAGMAIVNDERHASLRSASAGSWVELHPAGTSVGSGPAGNGSGVRRAYPIGYCFFSAPKSSSIFLITASSSGLVRGSKRAAAWPSRSVRTLAKFQAGSPPRGAGREAICL